MDESRGSGKMSWKDIEALCFVNTGNNGKRSKSWEDIDRLCAANNEMPEIEILWKDVRKDLNTEAFYNSKYWKAVREIVINRDNNRCTKCGVSSISGHLHAHHITYQNHGYEHIHLEDLVTLCGNCHKAIHEI